MIELSHVQTVQAAVTVIVEEPHEARVASSLAEAAQHHVEVGVIHVAIAVRVAKQTEESVHAVTACGAVGISVQFPPPAIMNMVRKDGERVLAFRQRTADEL